MNVRRLAPLLVLLGIAAVVGYLFVTGSAGRAERRAETAAFAVSHPGAEGTLVTLDVDGMDCPDCAKNVHDELAKVPGVVACRVDLQRHLAEVRLESKDVPPQMLVSAVSNAGYDARISR